VTFGITVNTYVRICGNIVHGHTCDEYSVLVSKPGMIEVVTEPGQPKER
jgi:hypothetical protein